MRSFFLPPVMFLAGVLAAFALPGEVILPLLPRGIAAASLFALGVGLMAWAQRRYQSHDSEINTFKTPRGLVTDGPFRFSRNPMYVSFTLMLMAAALAAGTAVAWSAVGGFAALCAVWYVPFEERAAEAAFGDAYLAYKARTPRWLGLPR